MAIRRRPTNSSDLRCDRCGSPAEWRTRVNSACCVLGEALCDSCESKNSHIHWWNQEDTFWGDIVDDAAWLAGKIFRRNQ